MTKTIELIKKHTQEYNDYMRKNGEYSFHRFTDGSIHFTKPIFITRDIVKATGILPLRPVRELEQLIKAATDDGALVSINDGIIFRGRDIILSETEIMFCNSSVRIEYTAIESIDIDFNYELRKIMKSIKCGCYGDTVFINGVETNIRDLVLLESEFMYFKRIKKDTHRVYAKYDDVATIADTEGYGIFWRLAK